MIGVKEPRSSVYARKEKECLKVIDACRILKSVMQISLYLSKDIIDILLIGSIIRCMRRLEELLRQMCQASKVIGNTELENKFAEGQNYGLVNTAFIVEY